MDNQYKFTFIGAGAMAEAIISGILHNKLANPEQIIAAEPLTERRSYIEKQYAVRTTPDNLDALNKTDIVVLCVKPQVFPLISQKIKDLIPSKAFILSIIAGLSIQSIQNGLNHTKVARVMPNTPAQIGSGMSVWTISKEISDIQKELTQKILASLGKEIFVEEEKFIDMATAISGSGPAYVYLFLEALIDAGVQIGLSRSMAEAMAAQTILGSMEYFLQSNNHPAQLRNKVTSPAGTTAAAIYQLEKEGLRTAVTNAVLAAYQRCLELG